MTPEPPPEAPRRRFRHWKRWLIGGIVVVVVLAVGVPYVYIHFIEGPAPARFSLSKSKAKAAASVPIAGTWTISSGSQAGYRIGEVLFGQNNTAVGRTNAVTGQMALDGSDTLQAATVTVDLTKVSSDSSQRDNQFQHRIMDTSSFPTTTFTLTKPVAFGAVPTGGKAISVTVAGTLNLHGTTRTVQAAISARQSGRTIQVSGSIPIVFADWQIPNPSFGPATTDDHGVIEFLLTFDHA